MLFNARFHRKSNADLRRFNLRLSACNPRPSAFKNQFLTVSNSAAILFVALWTLVILSILAIGISSRVTSEISLVKYLQERIISLYLAKASLNRAIIELEKDETPNDVTLYELQKIRNKDLGNGSFEFNLSDEESLVNINTASQSIIERLPGLNPDLAEAIIEYRNPPHPPFQLKEELLLVEGMTKEIYSGFKHLITIYGDGQVNINTASPEALSVLGLEDDLIEIILNYRKGEDGQEATEDDRGFQDRGSILNDLREFTILTGEQERQLIELQNLLCVGAKNLRLDIETKVLGNPIKNYTVILDRTQSKIRFWQET